jgi:peptide/nickel transport system permease protein
MQDTSLLSRQEPPAPPPAAENTILPVIEEHESYFQLVWRRFRRSKAAIAGALLVLSLAVMSLFADFFSPYSLTGVNLQDTFIAPSVVHMVDAKGQFHLQPFVYAQELTVNPKTFEPVWTENTNKIFPIHFFVQGEPYKFLGIFPSRLHLFGVVGQARIHLMGTDKFGRDLFGKSSAWR